MAKPKKGGLKARNAVKARGARPKKAGLKAKATAKPGKANLRRPRAPDYPPSTTATAPVTSRERAYEEASVGRLLHDESEADEDGFIAGAGFDRYGGFPGDGLS